MKASVSMVDGFTRQLMHDFNIESKSETRLNMQGFISVSVDLALG